MIASSVDHMAFLSQSIYVFEHQVLFDQFELNLILKFSTKQKPFHSISPFNLSQHLQSQSIFNSTFIIPPFNINNFRDDSSIFVSLGKSFVEMYQKLRNKQAELQSNKNLPLFIFIKSADRKLEEDILLNYMCSEQCIANKYGAIIEHPYTVISFIINDPELIFYDSSLVQRNDNDYISNTTSIYSRNQFNAISQFQAIYKLFETGAHIAIINDQLNVNIDDYWSMKGAINQIILRSTIPIEEIVFGIKFPKTIIIINNHHLSQQYNEKLMPTIQNMESSLLYGKLFTLNIIHVDELVDVIKIVQAIQTKLHRLQLKQITSYVPEIYPQTPPNSDVSLGSPVNNVLSLPEPLQFNATIQPS